MPFFICTTCGTQFAESAEPPAACRICSDERQYVGLGGQHWTLLELMLEEHENHLEAVAPGITSVETRPTFAIGQRALLVQHPDGNVLWDCVSFVDQETVDSLAALGGVSAIADLASAFLLVDGRVESGVRRRADPSPQRRRRLGVAAGSAGDVLGGGDLSDCERPHARPLRWALRRLERAARGGLGRGPGALLTGDTVKVGWDRQSVSVMRSYPNLIPVGPTALAHVEQVLAPLEYDDIHGAWTGHSIRGNAKTIVARSLARYRQAITE